MLALFKDENNQVDFKFLDTMYDTEESDPMEEMDPYSNFGSLDSDEHELEVYGLTQLQPQNLNRDNPFPTYQAIDLSYTESNQEPENTHTQDDVEPQSD